MSEALNLLAETAGIEPSVRDYFGNEFAVSDATKRALLSAMGYDAESDAGIVTALCGIEDAKWIGMLPPVTMLCERAPVHVICSLPAGEAGAKEVEWEIAFEDGRLLREALAPDDAGGETRLVGGQLFQRRRLTIDARAPLGYHRLTIRARATEGSGALIVVPEAGYLAPELEHGGRIWALATQLYALRSDGDWGIGDFTSLRRLAAIAAKAGAGAIALNPLHELYPSNPQAASPYAPSSRLFLNACYVDVTAVADFGESPEARAEVARPGFRDAILGLRERDVVDYEGVSTAKHRVLRLLYRAFCTNHLERAGDARAARFRGFVASAGRELASLALYEALNEWFHARDPHTYGWQQWPPEYRSPSSPAVARFARSQRAQIDYYSYVQWLADEQLARAAASGRERGIGLYRDLAVGVDLNGADAWSDPGTILHGASLGAPADPLNERGQNWGLPPLAPRALRERSYEPFATLLRANMRYATVLRIDHVMALRRAFWIPRGRPASEGAYVRYEFDHMLGILALESVRNRCLVVGEDLGTVPEGFRERLRAARALSSRLLYFERNWSDGTFSAPQNYPRLAAASIGTHDLSPLAGWWIGDDLVTRARLSLHSNDAGDAARAAGEERRHARFTLVDALEREGAIDAAGAHRLREDARLGGSLQVVDDLSTAVHRFLARTPSMLVMVAIEDVLGEVGAVNVPGTVDEHPNWRRRRSVPLEAFESDGRLFRIGAIMCDTQSMMISEGQG